jgi:hypothetical protein
VWLTRLASPILESGRAPERPSTPSPPADRAASQSRHGVRTSHMPLMRRHMRLALSSGSRGPAARSIAARYVNYNTRHRADPGGPSRPRPRPPRAARPPRNRRWSESPSARGESPSVAAMRRREAQSVPCDLSFSQASCCAPRRRRAAPSARILCAFVSHATGEVAPVQAGEPFRTTIGTTKALYVSPCSAAPRCERRAGAALATARAPCFAVLAAAALRLRRAGEP